ncbi:MAG: pyridoxamine 5'-phosphate oxidase family protein [Bryobacteraceae bacterium]|nr:pyridoxamine 5'-phosphate oxidase family protein [Bryobacteraceae bacterium]
MSHQFAQIAFTPHVKEVQEFYGSKAQYERMLKRGPNNDRLGELERSFVEARDGMYVATVSETGWPYVQFRGGPRGFLRVLDDNTLGFADFRGNRQYITVGNWRTNDRVALFLMDYPNRTRLKILGHAEVKTASEDPPLVQRLAAPGYQGVVERAVLIKIAGFDWNCQQHITPRWTEDELSEALAPIRQRLEALEAENRKLRGQIASGDTAAG